MSETKEPVKFLGYQVEGEYLNAEFELPEIGKVKGGDGIFYSEAAAKRFSEHLAYLAGQLTAATERAERAEAERDAALAGSLPEGAVLFVPTGETRHVINGDYWQSGGGFVRWSAATTTLFPRPIYRRVEAKQATPAEQPATPAPSPAEPSETGWYAHRIRSRDFGCWAIYLKYNATQAEAEKAAAWLTRRSEVEAELERLRAENDRMKQEGGEVFSAYFAMKNEVRLPVPDLPTAAREMYREIERLRKLSADNEAEE